MRDILLTVVVFGFIPFIFFRPHVGVLVWAWLSYMTPYRYAWSFAVDLRFAFIIAIVTLLAWVLSREPKQMVWNTATVLLLAFWVLTCLTTYLALHPEAAQGRWEELTKIILIDLVVTIALFQDRRRIMQLIWVIVLSISFFGVKGAIFTLLTGGVQRVGVVEGVYFSDNNLLAAALLMIIPLMRFLQLNTQNILLRWGLGIAMLLNVFAVLGTHSRGGFIGLVTVAALLFVRSRKSLALSIGLVTALVAGFMFMPESWQERIESIRTYKEEATAQSRFEAWEFGYELAQERPLTGGGFEAFRSNIVEATRVGWQSAHSIYFQVLGEQGFIGVALYLGVIVAVLFLSQSALRRARQSEELGWAADLLRMLQISLAAFLVTGALLSMAYFELFIHLIAITVVTARLVQREADQGARVESRHLEAGAGRKGSVA